MKAFKIPIDVFAFNAFVWIDQNKTKKEKYTSLLLSQSLQHVINTLWWKKFLFNSTKYICSQTPFDMIEKNSRLISVQSVLVNELQINFPVLIFLYVFDLVELEQFFNFSRHNNNNSKNENIYTKHIHSPTVWVPHTQTKNIIKWQHHKTAKNDICSKFRFYDYDCITEFWKNTWKKMNKTKTKMHFFLLWSVYFQWFFQKRTTVATYQMCSVNMGYRDANSIHESNPGRKSSTNLQSMCSAKFDAHNFIVSQFCLFDLNF